MASKRILYLIKANHSNIFSNSHKSTGTMLLATIKPFIQLKCVAIATLIKLMGLTAISQLLVIKFWDRLTTRLNHWL